MVPVASAALASVRQSWHTHCALRALCAAGGVQVRVFDPDGAEWLEPDWRCPAPSNPRSNRTRVDGRKK